MPVKSIAEITNIHSCKLCICTCFNIELHCLTHWQVYTFILGTFLICFISWFIFSTFLHDLCAVSLLLWGAAGMHTIYFWSLSEEFHIFFKILLTDFFLLYFKAQKLNNYISVIFILTLVLHNKFIGLQANPSQTH